MLIKMPAPAIQNQTTELSMPDSFLRYTDLASAVQRARGAGLTTIQIVRALSGATPHEEALKLAKRAAPLLDLTVEKFMELRKNKPGD